MAVFEGISHIVFEAKSTMFLNALRYAWAVKLGFPTTIVKHLETYLDTEDNSFTSQPALLLQHAVGGFGLAKFHEYGPQCLSIPCYKVNTRTRMIANGIF